MNDREIEGRLRQTLEEMASSAPLANPEHPRTATSATSQRHGPRFDLKLITLVGCLLVLIGTLVAVGIVASHHGSRRPTSSASSTPLPPSTTSLPLPGPYVVPNVVGLDAAQAIDDLRSAGLTNSIDNLNCPGSFLGGQVVGQNPGAGYRAASDSRVNIQISCEGTPTSTKGG
jgi:hypothetical protein